MTARQSPALALRATVLELLADGATMTAEQIADALDSTPRAVTGALTALKHQGDVVAFNGQRIRDYVPLMWRATVLPGVQLVREVRNPFRPYKPPAPTVIPVRAGNRVATPIDDGPPVGMGHWTRNEFSPTEKFR
jgi:hypothetical protein